MGVTSMAGGGEVSEATKPADVSSYERSQIRLQDSYKSMINAYLKMMSSAERWGATLRENAEGTRQWREESEGIPADGILSREIEASKSLLIKTLNDQDIPEIFTIQENIDRFGVVEVGSGDSEAELIDKDEAELGRVKEIAPPIKIPTRLSDGSRSCSTDMMEDTDPLNTVMSRHFEVPNPTEPSIQFELSDLEINKSVEEPQIQQIRGFQVNSKPSEFVIYGGAVHESSELVKLLIELLEIRMAKFRSISVECWGNISAHKVFVKMPSRAVHTTSVVLDCVIGKGLIASLFYSEVNGKFHLRDELQVEIVAAYRYSHPVVFDPGGFEALLVSGKDRINQRVMSYWFDLSLVITVIGGRQRLLDEELTFDPGGFLASQAFCFANCWINDTI